MDEILKHYETLGFKPGATEEQIKQAYRDLVKVWHPDRFAGSPRLQEKAQEKLKEINLEHQQEEEAERREPTRTPPKISFFSGMAKNHNTRLNNITHPLHLLPYGCLLSFPLRLDPQSSRNHQQPGNRLRYPPAAGPSKSEEKALRCRLNGKSLEWKQCNH